MPTYETLASFDRDYRDLNREQLADFKSALNDFIEDLQDIEEGRQTDFRGRLRVKSMRNAPGIFEMTWQGGDGRATFEYGDSIEEGKRHVVWRRIGGHDIFRNP